MNPLCVFMKTQPSIDQWHVNVPQHGTVRFHCRFQEAVHDFYRNSNWRISKAIKFAIQRFRTILEGGILDLTHGSSFLNRSELDDKVELYIRLTVSDKDLIEKLAFALRVSQAEMLRIALEWFMDIVMSQNCQASFTDALRKWHHGQSKLKPVSMAYSFWTFGRSVEWQFSHADDTSRAFDILKNPEGGLRGRKRFH